MKQRSYYYFIFGILLFLPATVSCSFGKVVPQPEREGEKIISLGIPIPENRLIIRKMANIDENRIETLDILSFDEDNNFYYHTPGTFSESNSTGAATQYFNVRIKHADRLQTLVAITNARNEVEALIATNPSLTKNELYKELKIVHSDGAKWNVEDYPHDKIPMWGESSRLVLGAAATTSITIPVLRMLARIDIAVDDTVDNFSIESISIRNTSREGTVVPNPVNLRYDEDGTTIKVVKATAGATTLKHLESLKYTDLPLPREIVNTIYIFETAATASAKDAACIIIGGKYGIENRTTYYRIDFFEANGETRKDLLRNHSYAVKITDVYDYGYPTESEAFVNKAYNIKAEVLELNENEMNHITLDDNHYLAVNKNKWLFSRDERSFSFVDNKNKLIVTTDFPSGWKAICSSKGGWLALSEYQSATNGQKAISILVPDNDTGDSRSGYITITAGLLISVISVTQNTEIDFDIEIVNEDGSEVTELIYGGNTPESQSVFIRYKPVTASVSLFKYEIGKPYSYDKDYFIITEDLSLTMDGLKKYDIIPRQSLANISEPFGLNLQFEIEYADSHSADNIYVYQKEDYAVFQTFISEVFGWPYSDNRSIMIYSNTSWVLTGDRSDLFTNITGAAIAGSNNFSYDLGYNKILPLNSNTRETLTLTLTQRDNPDEFVTKQTIIKPVHAMFVPRESTVGVEADMDVTLAELSTNLPKSLYTAGVIEVTDDANWLTGAKIEFADNKLVLKASYTKNMEWDNRVAVLTVDLGLNERLSYILEQEAGSYIDLPGFGWVRREDSNGPDLNNWWFAESHCNDMNNRLPTRDEIIAIREAYERLSQADKERSGFQDAYYWTSTTSSTWTFPTGMNAYVVNPVTGALGENNKSDGRYYFRCLRRPLND